jgi:hypothetical protein
MLSSVSPEEGKQVDRVSGGIDFLTQGGSRMEMCPWISQGGKDGTRTAKSTRVAEFERNRLEVEGISDVNVSNWKNSSDLFGVRRFFGRLLNSEEVQYVL